MKSIYERLNFSGPGFPSEYPGTVFGVDFNKLKSNANVQWVTKGIRLCWQLQLATRNVLRNSNFVSLPLASPRLVVSILYPFGSNSRSADSSAVGHLGKQTASSSDRGNEFDKGSEDDVSSVQRPQLAQGLFECGICLEEMPDDRDSIARPDPCGHAFCRGCLREHVTSRLHERRFPIMCPTCTAGKGKGKGAAGEVSQFLALELGLNEEQYNIWIEMEMVSFAILIHCRKCKRTMFLARDEHDETEIINCPLPDCNYAWCKECQQAIEFIGPKHSCDGTSELDHLMEQQGWKYCPECKTPIQKISGCSRMCCTSCHTYFCYVCGGLESQHKHGSCYYTTYYSNRDVA